MLVGGPSGSARLTVSLRGLHPPVAVDDPATGRERHRPLSAQIIDLLATQRCAARRQHGIVLKDHAAVLDEVHHPPGVHHRVTAHEQDVGVGREPSGGRLEAAAIGGHGCPVRKRDMDRPPQPCIPGFDVETGAVGGDHRTGTALLVQLQLNALDVVPAGGLAESADRPEREDRLAGHALDVLEAGVNADRRVVVSAQNSGESRSPTGRVSFRDR